MENPWVAMRIHVTAAGCVELAEAADIPHPELLITHLHIDFKARHSLGRAHPPREGFQAAAVCLSFPSGTKSVLRLSAASI
jgi:hypothetical protein